MERKDVATELSKVEELFNKELHNEAMALLQKCIDASRLESKAFMESLRDSTKDPITLDKLQFMYFMNFV